MKKISGVDGCKGGWLAFHFNGEYWSENLFGNINELYNESDSELILIDIPIGLRETESSERLCDLESRKTLNKRKTSIFPVPSRLATLRIKQLVSAGTSIASCFLCDDPAKSEYTESLILDLKNST